MRMSAADIAATLASIDMITATMADDSLSYIDKARLNGARSMLIADLDRAVRS